MVGINYSYSIFKQVVFLVPLPSYYCFPRKKFKFLKETPFPEKIKNPSIYFPGGLFLVNRGRGVKLPFFFLTIPKFWDSLGW